MPNVAQPDGEHVGCGKTWYEEMAEKVAGLHRLLSEKKGQNKPKRECDTCFFYQEAYIDTVKYTGAKGEHWEEQERRASACRRYPDTSYGKPLWHWCGEWREKADGTDDE